MNAVLLVGFGGPDGLPAVGPFMQELMGGREPTPEAVARAKEKYALIGGSSPLTPISRKQAAALGEALGDDFLVRVGMRYWRPSIEEAMREFAGGGDVGRLVVVSLSPFFSSVSTGSYFDEVKRVQAGFSDLPEVVFVEDWHVNPLYIAAVAAKVREALCRFQGGAHVVMSAHSLPVELIDRGEPYVRQLQETAEAVMDALSADGGVAVPWRLAFQSRGRGPGEWLQPEVPEVLDELAALGERDVLLVPLGFVSDHVETFYDIDIELRRYAADKGLHFERSAALNTSPLFIDALRDIVLGRLAEG